MIGRKWAAPALLAMALAVAGCGADSSGETTTPSTSVPAVTAPSVSTGAPSTPSKAKDKGGRGHDPSAPDSETNDLPPPKGGPQSSFEKECKRDPNACG